MQTIWIDYRKQGNKGEWSSVPMYQGAFADGAYDVFNAYCNGAMDANGDNVSYSNWETAVIAQFARGSVSCVTVDGISWDLVVTNRDNMGTLLT